MNTYKNTNERIPICSYLLVLMVILASKTLFWGIMHMKETMLITLFSFILYDVYMTKKKRFKLTKKSLMYFIIFGIFILLLSLCHFQDVISTNNVYIGNIILFFEVLAIGLLVVHSIDKRSFVKIYVHIMIVIALISLIFFFWFMINKNSILSICNVYQSGNSKYIGLPLYTCGWQTNINDYVYNYIFKRNAGPFWEPGAFQGFLIIALFLVINYKEYFKHKSIITLILLFTIMTTQSTTAYIVLLISLIGFSKDYVECLLGKGKILKNGRNRQIVILIMSLFFVTFVIYVIISSGNISSKFDVNNGSYIDRTKDIENSLNTLLNNSLIGTGFGSEANSSINGSATTILAIATYYGIPFALYYLYRFMIGCQYMYEPDSLKKRITLIVCFTCILMSETLYLLPTYAIFLFSNDKWSLKTLNKYNIKIFLDRKVKN